MDDQQHLLKQAKKFLEKENRNFEIDTASSGKEALEMLERKDYDAIVSDYQMPEIDGLDLLDNLRNKKKSDIPFLIFTGKGREEVAMEALNIGADRYIQKGGDPRSQYGVLAQAISQEVKHAEAEAALRESEKKYKSLFYETPLGTFHYDKDGIITECNEKFVEIIGSSKEQLIGLDMINDLQNKKIIEEIESSLEKGEGYYEGIYTSVTGGKSTYVRVFFKGMQDADGKIYAGMGLVEDITERKEAEKALRKSEEKYRKLFYEAPIGIFHYNEEGTIMECNEGFVKFMASSKDALIGFNIIDEIENKEVLKAASSSLKQGEGSYEGWYTSVTGGKKRYGRVLFKGLENNEGEINSGIGIVEDLTEKKEREERIKNLNSMLRTIRDVNQTIVQEEDLENLIKKTCQIMVDEGSIIGCSIALLDSGKITPLTQYGGQIFSKKWSLSTDGEGEAPTCIKKTIRSREIQLMDSAECDECDYSMTDRDRKCVFVPMERDEKIIGILIINVEDFDEATPEMKELLVEIGNDLAFAWKKKKIQKKLEESEKKFRNLAQTTSMAIMVYQNDKWVYANPAAEEISGYSAEELKTMKFWDFVAPEFLEKVKKRGKKREEGIEALSGYEFKIITKQGEEKWVYLEGTSTEYEGEPAGLISVIEITDRKKAEKELKKSEKKYRRIIEQMDNVYYRSDIDGNIVMASPSAEDLIGYDMDNIIGEKVESFYVDEDDRKEFLKQIKEKGEVNNFETKLQTKEDDVVHVLVNSHLIRNQEGDPVGIEGIISDITERREKEKRQELLNSLLSHDVKNNIQVAKGYVQLLNEDLEEKNEHSEKLMNVLKKSEDIIEKVKILDELEEEEDDGEVNIAQIIDDVVSEYREVLDDRGIGIEIDKIDCKVRAGKLLDSTIRNILENSIKHSRCHKIYISVLSKDDKCSLTIKDDGKGIADENKDKIFLEGFKKGEKAGSGLGLFLVKEIVENYGGSIDVYDSKEGGTRFDIKLEKVR